MKIDLNILIQVISILSGLWGIWYFLLIPKLKYKIEILPVITPTLPLDKLKILFADKPIRELSIVCISIYNKGMGIAENFTTPIKVLSNKQFLEFQVDRSSTQNKIVSKFSISKDRKSVDLNTNFINRGEEITCYCIMEGTDNIDIKILGRCKGCSKINSAWQIPWRSITKYAHWVFLLLFLSFIAIGSSLLKNRVRKINIKLNDINQNVCLQISNAKKIQATTNSNK